jgi:hypothetical protein
MYIDVMVFFLDDSRACGIVLCVMNELASESRTLLFGTRSGFVIPELDLTCVSKGFQVRECHRSKFHVVS